VLSLSVYSDAAEHWIVLLGDASTHRRVHVDGLPNFIALLNEVLPAVRGVAELEERDWRAEQERLRKRRGPTVYDDERRCMRYARAGE
jgi:hypothetical protein